jgi:hypothetical protein
MSEIITSDSTELADERVRAIGMRIVRTAEVAMDKAVAHHVEPGTYRIASDPNSFEQIFLSRFRKLGKPVQKAAETKVMARVSNATMRQRQYRDLSRIDLRSATSVEEQAKTIELPEKAKLSMATLRGLTIPAIVGLPTPAGLVPQQTTDNLELRIHKVQCIDETGGGWGGEWGDDEIYLGGSTVDETGDVGKVAQFKVGDFNDGTVKTYSAPKRFAAFGLREGSEWPKQYFATMVLAEKDAGGFSDFIDNLVRKVKDELITYLSAAGATLGALAGGGAPGALAGALLGALAGFVINKIFDALRAWWGDDIFRPITVWTSIPSLSARWAGKTDSPQGRVTWRGHNGEYRLWYDWRLYA